MEQVANLKTSWHITTTYTQPTTFSSPEPWFLLGHDETEGSGSSNYRMSMIYACICMIIACISAHAQKLNPRRGERHRVYLQSWQIGLQRSLDKKDNKTESRLECVTSKTIASLSNILPTGFIACAFCGVLSGIKSCALVVYFIKRRSLKFVYIPEF